MIYSNPSFETEKHTHAFGAMLWWAVSLISMFTVGTGVTAIGLLRFASVLTTSYKFDSNTIIKGTLAARGGLISKITANTDFERAIQWVRENGIMLGNTDGDMMLDQPVTRKQFAVMLYRYHEKFGR